MRATDLRPILSGMSRKPQPPPQTTSWAIYRAVHRAAWLGTVEAVDEADAIEKAAEKFKEDPAKLIAVATAVGEGL